MNDKVKAIMEAYKLQLSGEPQLSSKRALSYLERILTEQLGETMGYQCPACAIHIEVPIEYWTPKPVTKQDLVKAMDELGLEEIRTIQPAPPEHECDMRWKPMKQWHQCKTCGRIDGEPIR